jgi:hypothetical protein
MLEFVQAFIDRHGLQFASVHGGALVEKWQLFGAASLFSKAALRQIGLTDRHADARRVLKWAIANRKTELSVKDVRRVALSQSVDAKS